MIIDDPQYASTLIVITASWSAFEFEKIQRLDPRQDRRREHRSGGDATSLDVRRDRQVSVEDRFHSAQSSAIQHRRVRPTDSRAIDKAGVVRLVQLGTEDPDLEALIVKLLH